MFAYLILVLTLITSEINCDDAKAKNIYRRNYNRYTRTNCLRGDCHPETGDLLIGRTKFLHASSTCGLESPERYCVLGTTRDATKCFVCDSSEPFDLQMNNNSHTVENIVSRQPGDRFSRWWQSENGRQDVYIQFDLEAEFSFTHIIMTFKTFRPAAMLIEKSSNFGKTWKTYAYFAYNCEDSFPGVSTSPPRKLGDVYCESKYSSETPSTKGEIILRILPPTLVQSKDPYSSEIQDLLKITNLRVNFTKLHTFGDNLLDNRDEIKDKYYYAMYEMVVRGSCLCYGHASRCIQVEGVQYDDDITGMVHGQCECAHNTAGTNCEQCLPLYNDLLWRPARNGQTNECKKCQCNNHAFRCHFDQQVFNETNGQSGGVCDNCEHNTMGRNCELCKANHYRDPNRPIDDLFTCKPCECNLDGSLRDGVCDPKTDEENGLIAGRCHCKELVEGDKCDRCKNGFFNLTKENPDGCEPCSCDLIGTAGNLGCDKLSGYCSCKQFVTGRACNQCLPGYYGLSSEDPNGCKPCDCYVGGSINSTCDPKSGQCFCKPNMSGRRCDKPESGFYCPAISHLLYEAESATKLDQRSQDVLRPIYADSRMSWTGPGFVKVFDGAKLEFTVDNIPTAGLYELVIRYENQLSEEWETMKAKVVRDNTPVDLSGPCGKFNSEDNEMTANLPASSLYHVLPKASCFEPNRVYNIILDFTRHNSTSGAPTNRDATLLIDSILLVPVVDSLAIFQNSENERLLAEYKHYGCREQQLNPHQYAQSEYCAKFACSIGVAAISALPCKCDPTGSLSNMCDENGGACKCKPNVVGRACDQCAPSTWGFGPNGCQACNCNSGGAKNNFCNLETGLCDCFENIQGSKCDECVSNHWQFPACLPCNCHGFADNCNQTTGICINCKDHTTGLYCENCEEGYYGRPTAGQACKECMCPGGATGNKFANTCFFDPRYDSIVCNCNEGYVGTKCEKCAVNYYGNPVEPGGSCKRCECNDNIDINDPESCNQDTGKCKKCLFNTDGDHCEVCKEGFYGNASNHECQACNCYPDGTEGNSVTNCDRNTGQCKCLPNVIGKHCDECKPDHYGLASGTGCLECDCSFDGTHNRSTSCDHSTGQCSCLDSRGGRTCSECRFGYWGDPEQECKRCECSITGSVGEQCDKQTGACLCRKGIAGYHCDRCDRGTYGEIPFCSPCGECFDDWNTILNNLKNELDELEAKASNLAIASSSPIKDFMSQYTAIEDKLNDIKKIMGYNFTDRQLKSIAESIANIEKQIAQKKESKKKFYNIEAWNDDNPAKQLEKAREEYSLYKEQANDLINQVMNLKESTKGGAIDSIDKAQQLANEVQRTIDAANHTLKNEFDSLYKQLKLALEVETKAINDIQTQLNERLNNETNKLATGYNSISALNSEVCGATTSENQLCDNKCGGAGCLKCGTNSSSCSGLVDAYWDLVSARQRFENLYNQQETAFKRLLTKWRNATNLLTFASKETQELVDRVNQSLNLILNKRNEMQELTQTIKSFTEKIPNLSKKIEEDCDYVLEKNHEINEAELNEILKKISDLATNINVNTITDDAQSGRQSAEALLNNVNHVSLYLPGIQADLNRTQVLIESNQNKTEDIEKLIGDVTNSNENLKSDLQNTKVSLDNTVITLDDIENSIDNLRLAVEFDNKDKGISLSKQETLKGKIKESGVTMDRMKNNLAILESKLNEITSKLQNIHKEDGKSIDTDVLVSLFNLQSSISAKKNMLDQRLAKLKSMENEYSNSKSRIENLNQIVNGLQAKSEQLQQEIYDKANFFSSCN